MHPDRSEPGVKPYRAVRLCKQYGELPAWATGSTALPAAPPAVALVIVCSANAELMTAAGTARLSPTPRFLLTGWISVDILRL